jgi:hypothetical protein
MGLSRFHQRSHVQVVDEMPWIATKVTKMIAKVCMRVEGFDVRAIAVVGIRR